MLHYVCQLVSDCVSLPFDVEQVVFRRFSEPLHERQQPAATETGAMRVFGMSHNNESVGQTMGLNVKQIQ